MNVNSLGAVEFYRCCFVHTFAKETHVPIFLSLTGTGTVRYSSVCFDASEAESVRTDQSVTVVYEPGHEYFVDCECREVPDPFSSALSSSDETIPTDTEPEETILMTVFSETVASESEMMADTQETNDTESGGGKAKAGMIAGIVIPVIVVIIVVVLLILLLPRCKKFKSSDEGSVHEESTEETITSVSDHTATENTEDWHGTQDNPLFASENFGDEDDGAFSNAFEEQGDFH